MSSDEKDENTESPFLIKVLHISNADTSKTFGEILKNPSGRNLLEALKEKQMYVNEMHKQQDMRVSLISHHLNKLIDLGLLNISEKPINKKTKNHRFFKTKHDAYLILIKKEEGIPVEEVHKYSILNKIFNNDLVKLSCVGIAGVSTWIATNIIDTSTVERITTYPILASLLTITVIGLGLFVIYYSKKHKKN